VLALSCLQYCWDVIDASRSSYTYRNATPVHESQRAVAPTARTAASHTFSTATSAVGTEGFLCAQVECAHAQAILWRSRGGSLGQPRPTSRS
jgi:hypothetical protein